MVTVSRRSAGKAAQVGIRILAGEDATKPPPGRNLTRRRPMFDWRGLRRWKHQARSGLPPGKHPSGFKEATYWEQHHKLILGAVFLVHCGGILDWYAARANSARRRAGPRGSLPRQRGAQ